MLLTLLLALGITLPAPTLTGRVVDADTGRPLRDCDVTLHGLYRLAGTDSLGRFALPDIPAGEYEMTVSSPYHEKRTFVVHGGTRQPLQLTLKQTGRPPFEVARRRADPTPFPPRPMCRLEVVVVDTLGQRQPGVSVLASVYGLHVLTDSLGTYTYDAPYGQVTVVAGSSRYADVSDTTYVNEPFQQLLLTVRPRVFHGGCQIKQEYRN